MKNDTKKMNSFDDAVPERFLDAVRPAGDRRVRIDIGSATPSPYIVKLAREEARHAAAAGDVAREIEALAKSLIIEGDDDIAVFSEHAEDNGLHLSGADVFEQMREFDTMLPEALFMSVPKTSARSIALPKKSLDDALASILEEPMPLEALIPLANEEVAGAQDWTSHRTNGKSTFDQLPSVEQESSSSWASDEFSPVDSGWRRVFRFEWGFLRHSAVRGLAAFVVLSFVVVLPLHAMQSFSGTTNQVGQVQAVGTAALDDVARATSALTARDFGSAQEDFSSAAAKFSQAEDSLNDLQSGVVAIVNVIPQTDRTLKTVRGLVTAGRELSQTASIMSQAGEGIASQKATDVVTKLSLLSAYVENALPHALAAQGALVDVDPAVVPADYMDKVAQLQAQGPAIAQSMQEFLQFVDTLTFLLGGEEKMRYLTLFQNNTELRPTGGFVGSFAEIDMDNGAMTNLRLPGGGSYDVQGQLQEFVESPKPLSLINPRWEFHDGNWFPDFPTSAKKMQWFYEHAGGPTTDGVIAVNASFVEKLLGVVGAVEMPEYGKTIDAENFLFETQKIVEIDYDRVINTPKAFLGDLAPKLLEKVKEADIGTLLKVLALVEQGLEEKDIQVYFRNEDAQKAMKELGFAGAIQQTAGDYFMMVDTNIGGGKTDSVIDQAVDIDVDIAETGTITNSVTITKTHRGLASALFNGRNNVDYLRVYVPEGSVLLSADGFEPPSSSLFEKSDFDLQVDDDLSLIVKNQTKDAISGMDIWDEFGKTVFGGWVQTAPGETQTIHISYRIPQTMFPADADTSLLARARRGLGFDNQDAYSMFVQKQSGVKTRTTTVHIDYPKNWNTRWTSLEGADTTTAQFDNARDNFAGWLLTR
ncbi:MAG: DUF4012 domain-containing protein [Patescibacteria group bacterium]